jgi:transcriptional regulator with PAS, ATPase and Fis domain
MDKKLADIIKKHQKQILQRWEEQVLRKVPAYTAKHIDELRKNMRGGFDGLFEYLSTGKKQKLAESIQATANLRFSEGFGVGDVLKAILIAKPIIIDTLFDTFGNREHIDVFLTLEDFFIEAVSQFAQIFQEMRNEIKYLKNIVGKEFHFDNIIGKSKQMKDIFALIPLIAGTTAAVLVMGKSGTGKELIAKAIHFHSQRRDRNFVAINCSALPETLLESEMFGYVRGAFTGADQEKEGLFHEAEKGTVFLDEIGDMSLALQAKLLRVLQEKEYKKVGGTKTIKADVRLITATNKDLRAEMAAGRFREDLYYRINVISIYLPELKERKEDIPLLIQHFINKYNHESKRDIKGISQDALKALIDYNWQGNIRELENVIERAIILCNSTEIKPENLPSSMLENHPNTFNRNEANSPASLRPSINEAEKTQIQEALDRNEYNRSKTAAELLIDRKTLYRKMKQYGLLR